MPDQPPADQPRESIRETLISIIIAFALAFIFRSYVIEPFVIPTGSMAPTLLGAHVQASSPFTGDTWALNYRDVDPRSEKPLRMQGDQRGPIEVTDPQTGPPVDKSRITPYPGEGAGLPLSYGRSRLRAGDRILVLKHIYALRAPRRWEVIVFKSPESRENFIKRLVGLPGESVRIVDGDIFTRPSADDSGPWTIARKPFAVQRHLWRPIFSSEYTPIAQQGQRPTWSSPWIGQGWDTTSADYVYQGSSASATLAWDDRRWPITDWVPYNETMLQQGFQLARFPVGDVRLRAGVTPTSANLVCRVILQTRSHEFLASVAPDAVVLRMRRAGDENWTELARGPGVRWKPGKTHNLELWHNDQSLSLWIDGDRRASATYAWSADERLRFALRDLSDEPDLGDIIDPERYTRTQARFEFEGVSGGVALHRVGLDRDLYYQAGRTQGRGGALRGVTKATAAVLGDDEYFVLGDNSPASRDARMWSSVDPWVADQIDDHIGVVPRKLIMGKAFFVYWPAAHQGAWGLPIPDFGRMRFIF